MSCQDSKNHEFSPLALLLLVAFFFFLGLLLILNHAMWRDEWQSWLIARDSRSLAGLFHNMRYEGHPALWYLALFGLSRLTEHPQAMQLLHLALATATAYVFLRFSPFTKLQKILFIFSYFPCFEYSVISRNYILGILMIFAYCAVFSRDFSKKYLVLAGLLFLLCQTTVYGVLVAVALAASLFVGEYTANRSNLAMSRNEFLAVGLILLAGIGLAGLQMMPPPDSGFSRGWNFNFDWLLIVRTVDTIWNSYIPIPRFQWQFWNTNLLLDSYIKALYSILLIGFSFFLFRRQPAVLVLFALGTLGILSFSYLKYPGDLRHHGHLFLIFMASLWLSSYYPVRDGKPRSFGKLDHYCQRYRNGFIVTILVTQLLTGLLAASLGLYYPFSANKETANYIREQGIADMLIAGDVDYATIGISGYLNRNIFHLTSGRWSSFIIWDLKRTTWEYERPDKRALEALQRARQLAEQQRQELLLILNHEVKSPEPGVIPLRQFPRSIVRDEAFFLYLVKPSEGR